MNALRDLVSADAPVWLAAGGLLIGFAFGAIAQATNFCTMGAISDVMTLKDWRRLRAWLLAAGTALLGAQLLQWGGAVDLSLSMYLSARLNWVGHTLGGLMFGFGMVFAGGCASRNLVRAGSGDVRSLLVLVVIGSLAYITIGGILGPLRAMLEKASSISLSAPTQSLGDLLAPYIGMPGQTAQLIAAAAILLPIFVFCFASSDFRSSRKHVWAGIGVGLTAAAGWLLTGLAFDEMADWPKPPISLTYVRPIGDAMEWLERFTAAPLPGFGVATVIGALLGAFVMATATGSFRVIGFAGSDDTLRHLMGATLMGIGGVMALGCTIGQGVSGISTLAAGSFLTVLAIVLGTVFGVKTLERWLASED
jgi:uncharacterized membrane protein YedE/YeeE